MIKAVIFDYGGVVKKRHKCIRDIASTYSVSQEIIIQEIRPFIILFQKGLITENQFWKGFSSALKKPIPEKKRDLWRRGYEDNFYIYPSIISFIKKLRIQNIKTAVLSNVIKPHTEIATKHGGYKDFDVVVLSYKVNLLKPDLEIYLLTVKRLGVKPEECIFIDDRDEHLKPARKLRMKTVLANNPKQVIADVSRILNPH